VPSDEEFPRTSPYVVVFYYEGDQLRARIRDVRSQELWIGRDAARLRELLQDRKKRGLEDQYGS